MRVLNFSKLFSTYLWKILGTAPLWLVVAVVVELMLIKPMINTGDPKLILYRGLGWIL